MKSEKEFEPYERLVAALLWNGTWLASAVIAAGMAWEAIRPFETTPDAGVGGDDLVKAGVALFILLPITRVALMLAVFVRRRDWTYSAITALVLAITGVGIVVAG